ncbi:TPA: ABC transporter substrate-binding protein, partial [Streptococcus agalactiae]
IAQAVLKLQKTIEKKGKPTALFVMANSGELLTQSPSGRFGWIFSVGGFKAVNENEKLSSHGTPVSYEYIAEKNPNYLFVLDRGATIGQGASSKELFNNDVIKATDAVKNKRVHEVDGKDWYINSGGSRVTLRMIKDVQNFVDNR